MTGSNGTLSIAQFLPHLNYFAIRIGNLTDWSWLAKAPSQSSDFFGSITLGYEV
jgi:hypothetical protein